MKFDWPIYNIFTPDINSSRVEETPFNRTILLACLSEFSLRPGWKSYIKSVPYIHLSMEIKYISMIWGFLKFFVVTYFASDIWTVVIKNVKRMQIILTNQDVDFFGRNTIRNCFLFTCLQFIIMVDDASDS